MGDVMLLGVLEMPYDMAMHDAISRYQYHSRGHEAAQRIKADAAAITEAQAAIARLEARLADVTGAAARLDDTRMDQMRRLRDFAAAFAAEVADTYPAAAKSFCEGLAALSPGTGE